MLFRTLLFCILVSAGSAVSCRWMDHQYRSFRDRSLELLTTMMHSIVSTEEAELQKAVAFPNKLYRRAEEKLSFVAQVLDEIITLFEEDQSYVSWDKSTVDNFLNIVSQQADGLRTCVHSHKKKNRKLSKYFKRLLRHVLKQMGHSTKAWELICEEVKLHLYRVDMLVSTTVHNVN